MLKLTGNRVAFRSSGKTFSFAVVSDGSGDLIQVPLEQTQEDRNLRRVAMGCGHFNRTELTYLVAIDAWTQRVTIDGQLRDISDVLTH
jgi:hypothetical protein